MKLLSGPSSPLSDAYDCNLTEVMEEGICFYLATLYIGRLHGHEQVCSLSSISSHKGVFTFSIRHLALTKYFLREKCS